MSGTIKLCTVKATNYDDVDVNVLNVNILQTKYEQVLSDVFKKMYSFKEVNETNIT